MNEEQEHLFRTIQTGEKYPVYKVIFSVNVCTNKHYKTRKQDFTFILKAASRESLEFLIRRILQLRHPPETKFSKFKFIEVWSLVWVKPANALAKKEQAQEKEN